MHYSSQRREQREVSRLDRATGKRVVSLQAPKAGQHDDWIDADDFIWFLRELGDVRVDVMLEAKRKDEAVLRLRSQIAEAGLGDRIS